MKKIIIAAGMLLSGVVFAQQAPTPNPASDPTTSLPAPQKGQYAWFRGGNGTANPAGTNNIFGTMWNSPIYTYTNSINRMIVNGTRNATLNGFNVNTSGYVGIGNPNYSPLVGGGPIWSTQGPFSLLHLNGEGGGQENGFRPWMQTGITLTENFDLAYVGNRIVDGVGDRNEFTMAWSNDPTSTQFGPDDMVFRFLSGRALGAAGSTINSDFSVPNDLDGRHIARFTGNGELGLGNTFGLVQSGVGYIRPQSLLHMSLYQTSPVWLQMTNQTGTGQTVTDGLRIGITTTGTAHINQQENLPLIFYTGAVEDARIVPAAASTLPGNHGMIGVGNFSAPAFPIDAKLDIDGDLRIRTVTQDTTLLQVLVIDSNDHNRVHWRSIDDLGGNVTADNGLSIDPANNVQLGHLPGNTGGELIRNTEIPTNGYNITFPGGGTSGIDQFIIGNPLTTSAAKFQVWSESEDFSVIGINSVLGTQVSVGVRGQSLGGAIHNIGVQGISTSQSNQNVGIRGIAANGNNYNLAGDFDIPATTTLNNWGVHSEVVGSSSGRNVGGELNAIGVNNQQNYGVICRASSGNINYGIYSSAFGGTTNWAGYFNGNVYISGTYGPSDANLKTNVLEITNAIDVINQLNPVSFDFDNAAKPRLNLQQGKQYGLIAQEVETILPELVGTSVLPAEYDSLGNEIDASFEFKTLDYEKFVPILIAGMKEQQEVINDLQSTIEDLKNCLNNANICTEGNKTINQELNNEVNQLSIELTNHSSIILDQNLPNPFAENTVINYNIPTDVMEAKLMFYDLNGRIIKELIIEERGESKLTVYGENLKTGIYTYSLIADGELIATKKMVKK